MMKPGFCIIYIISLHFIYTSDGRKFCRLTMISDSSPVIQSSPPATELHYPQASGLHIEPLKTKKSVEAIPVRKKNLPKDETDMGALYSNAATGIKNEMIYGGDIILTEEVKSFLKSTDQDFGAAMISDKSRWPNGVIFYVIDDTVAHVTNVILQAMEKWSEFSCVSFLPAADLESDYIKIRTTGKGCFACMGKCNPAQTVSLDPACQKLHIVVHELGHALGLWHEHSRSDRDSYLTMYYDNIPQGIRSAFGVQKDFYTSDTPYDFGSVMHYPLSGYVKEHKYSMLPKNPDEEARTNTIVKPSFYDFKILNDIYKCEAPCKTSQIRCRNLGFLTSNSKGQCVCVCRDNFVGKFCEQERKNKNCNKFVYEDGPITPDNPYPANVTCIFFIQAPKGKKASVYFNKIHFKNCENTIRIRLDDISGDEQGKTYCGFSKLEGKTYTSTTQHLIIILKIGASPNHGFDAYVSFID